MSEFQVQDPCLPLSLVAHLILRMQEEHPIPQPLLRSSWLELGWTFGQGKEIQYPDWYRVS
jgi:hypothetical protein